MDAAPSLDAPCGVAGALGALRHALADPLSAAGLRLELLERRLQAFPGGGRALWDDVRSARAELAAASRLLDLLSRLGRLADEAPEEISIAELCRSAGVSLDSATSPSPRLVARRLASQDALRCVFGLFRPPSASDPPPRVRAEAAPERLLLRIEGAGAVEERHPERLVQLSRGDARTEELFLARAAIEADGGRLQLAEEGGLLVALLSWPRPPPGAGWAPPP